MSGDQPPGGPLPANALRDQATPNVLGHAEVHLAPEHAARDSDGRAIERLDAAEVEGVASRLQALANAFAARSEGVEAGLLEDFQKEAARLAGAVGELAIRDTDDERLFLRADGSFSGKIVPDDAPTTWRALSTPRDVVDFYDPSDLFTELADRLAEAFPGIGSADDDHAGPRLRQLAEAFASWSAPDGEGGGAAEDDLIERFEEAAAPFTRTLGQIIFKDDSDERLSLERDGRFLVQIIPDDDQSDWRTLRTPDAIVEFYAPRELLDALADVLGRAYPEVPGEDPAVAANTLHVLALLWRERAFDAEATLFDDFRTSSAHVARALGELVIVDDDDERLVIGEGGELRAGVLDRSSGTWRELRSPDELVQFYDPTDVFEDLADALGDAFPAPGAANEG